MITKPLELKALHVILEFFINICVNRSIDIGFLSADYFVVSLLINKEVSFTKEKA